MKTPKVRESFVRYWHKNVFITLILLVVWAAVGLGCGVMIADQLNQYNLIGTGFPLGFWFAHQGSIIVFVLLILLYAVFMNRFDAQHHDELKEIERKGKI